MVQGGEAGTAGLEDSWGSQPLQLFMLWVGRGSRKQSWHQELTLEAPAEPMGLILVPRHPNVARLSPHPTSSSCHNLQSFCATAVVGGARYPEPPRSRRWGAMVWIRIKKRWRIRKEEE